MTSEKLSQAWYVLHTKSRFENVVSQGLTKKSITVFLPKIQVRSSRKDRKKMIQIPLFPGYVFVRTNLDPREHLEIMKTNGAVHLIGTAQGPVPVPSEDIASLKIMVAGNNKVITGDRFQKGNKVQVTDGPFAGVTGTFAQYRGQGRVIVHIGALGQFAAVEVDEDDIGPLPEKLS